MTACETAGPVEIAWSDNSSDGVAALTLHRMVTRCHAGCDGHGTRPTFLECLLTVKTCECCRHAAHCFLSVTQFTMVNLNFVTNSDCADQFTVNTRIDLHFTELREQAFQGLQIWLRGFS